MAPRNLTFRDLVKLYCAQARPNEPRDYRLKKWLDLFGDRPAWGVSTDDLVFVLDRLGESYAPATVNREQGDMTCIYNWAIKNRRRTGCPDDFTNPLANHPKLPETMRRVQMSDAEVERLLALARGSTYPRFYGLVLAALTTGGRKNELRRMTWRNTSLERGLAEIGTDHKSGDYRVLSLTDGLINELQGYDRHDLDALVFCRRRDPWQPYDERSEWLRVRRQLGREDLHWHDLRHVCTQRLLRSGVNLHTVSRVLGHKDSRMVARRYGALEATDLRAAVQAAGGSLQ